MSSRLRTLLLTSCVAVLGVVLAVLVWSTGNRPAEMALDTYLGHLSAGRVTTATVRDAANRVEGELEDGTRYTVPYPAEYADELTAQLAVAPNGVEVRVSSGGGFLGRISGWVGNLLPLLVVGGALVLIWAFAGTTTYPLRRLRSFRGGARPPKETYSDVAGVDEAIEELEDLQQYLADPRRFKEIGARAPRGVLLCGPSGTGKSLLARATAGEAGVPLFSMSGSDFVNLRAGESSLRIRDLFRDAHRDVPAIVFMDDLEVLGHRHAVDDSAIGREQDRALGQLLAEIDSLEPDSGIVVLAATNRPEVLDPSLLRPGRFHRRISLELPDLDGRRKILELHTRRVPTASEVDLDSVARHTAGFSGADLAAVVNEAALLSARAGEGLVRSTWFEEAVDRMLAGPEKSGRIPSAEERRITAVHESGHAVVITAMQGIDPVHKVSIVGRDRALGMTVAAPEDDRELRTRSELVDDLVALLAGRAAETVILGEPSSAAADDIHRATEIARGMVCDLGMSETLGPRRIGMSPKEGDVAAEGLVSDDLAARVDDEIGRLLAEASSKAVNVVMANRLTIERLANELLDHETVRGATLEALLSGVVAQPPVPFGGGLDAGVSEPDVIAELGEREEAP